ncbi:restriction endonuclease subunit S [Vibrio breoganii]
MSFDSLMLEDLNIQLIDGDRGKNYPKQSEFQEKGHCLFLSAKNVTKTGFQFAEKVYISEDRHNRLRSGKLERNDIVLTTRGTIGNVAFYDDSIDDEVVRVNSGMLILRADSSIWNPRFLYFLFTSRIVQEQIASLTSGSAVPQLPAKDLKKFSLPRIPLEAQSYIVKVIGDLSDKLVINTQTNQTLEQMAQAIFKSWFVDFDPVKAKMKGEQPEGMDDATASLFPEKLVESELGLIPEGWGVGELSKLFELHRGFDLPKSKRQDGEYPVYAAGGYHGTHNEFKMEPPGIITGRSGVIGNVYLSLDKYWPLNTTLYVREFRTCGPYYAYHLLRSLDLKSLNSGSAVPSLNRNFVHSTNVSHPDSDVLAKFEEIVTPLFEKMVANNEQNKSLSELRDTLLPKLLSGEIELDIAEVNLND